MPKIDLEKLLCSLTNIEITDTYLASCFQGALREQGLVCDDGKIKSIWNFVNDNEDWFKNALEEGAFDVKEETKVAFTKTVTDKECGVEFKNAIDIEEMFQDYLKELGDNYSYKQANAYRRGILDTLKKLNIQKVNTF